MYFKVFCLIKYATINRGVGRLERYVCINKFYVTHTQVPITVLFSTEWIDYVEEPMKYQALRPHFFSVVGWDWVGLMGGQGQIQDLIKGGAPDRDRPKTAILGPQFCRILVLGPHFWWSGGGPGPLGPPLDPPLEGVMGWGAGWRWWFGW